MGSHGYAFTLEPINSDDSLFDGTDPALRLGWRR